MNPSLSSVVRTHGDEERAYLEERGVDRVVMGEHALALSLLDYVLAHRGEAGFAQVEGRA
ncbi:hypothetical protein [Pyxidicoccus fallax]|uniref:hypothetical protein n=1 Tax=Pyxidicoccus fallax TaxID=394095 RepID=UPI001FEA8E14|nr:hypothetical protein [Pyxidicoccus fallax]